MTILIMLQGLPASGKTTKAREYVQRDDFMRVSKDDLRAMLDNGRYSSKREEYIKLVRNAIIESLLKNGVSVVCDDTNLNPEHQDELMQIAKSTGAIFLRVPLDTSVAECIMRDSKRDNPVGEDVIRGMFEKYYVRSVI